MSEPVFLEQEDFDAVRANVGGALLRLGQVPSAKWRREVYRKMKAGQPLDPEEQRFGYSGLTVYTGGMGALGCGTLPYQLPRIQAMQDLHERLYFALGEDDD